MGFRLRLLMLVCLCLLPLAALGEASPTDMEQPLAVDITADCLLSGSGRMDYIRDGAYNTIWDSSYNGGKSALIFSAPAGSTLGGIMIHWWRFPLAITIQTPDGQGGWRYVEIVEGKY